MASPVDANRIGTNIATAVSPWTISLPTGIVAGDLLLLFTHNATNGFLTIAGWTVLLSRDLDLAGMERNMFYKWADGSESTSLSVAPLVGACKGCTLAWRITGAANPATRTPELVLGADFTTAANAANPPSISPTGGSKDYLFLIVATCDGETTTFSHATYTNVTNANSGTAGATGTNNRLGGASLQKTAATEDPAAFTHTAANVGGGVVTVAVHPAASAATSLMLPNRNLTVTRR